MSRISRRTLIAGSVLVPIAGIGLRGALAQDNESDETPGASPEASPMASPGASPMASPAAGSNEVTVIAIDIDFEQSEMRFPADTDVTVILENHGVLEHNWVVDELDAETETIPGGETTSIVVNAPAGEYEYYCSVPGHKEAGMVGTLIVE